MARVRYLALLKTLRPISGLEGSVATTVYAGIGAQRGVASIPFGHSHLSQYQSQQGSAPAATTSVQWRRLQHTQTASSNNNNNNAATAAAASQVLPPLSPTKPQPQDDPFLIQAATAAAGPLATYRDGRLKKQLRKDARQEATVLQLQRLYEDLCTLYPTTTSRHSSGLTLMDAQGGAPPITRKEKSSWWSGLLAGSPNVEQVMHHPKVQGLYMYGGVGVGKTMLMDLFADTAPANFKLERTHYHDFMIEVHTALRHHQSKADPLTFVADDISNRINVLCLDELFVTDVADAMILHRLFGRLWDKGLVLVGTSNRHPDALYEGGLQRSLFMPFIHRLKETCHIHDMNSTTDYRRLAHHSKGLYFLTAANGDEELEARFVELSNKNKVESLTVNVAMGRQLHMPKVGGCIAMFTFDELCGRPLGAADYIALAQYKHTVAVSGVPVFTAANRSAAYRFVTLVDVFYEHRIRFLCSAEAMPFELFKNIKTHSQAKSDHGPDEVVDDNLGFAKDRTVSRLIEMQSVEYLIAHSKENAPELLLALEEKQKRNKA